MTTAITEATYCGSGSFSDGSDLNNVVVFALLSLRAIAFVAYQGLNGTAFEEEEIIVAGIGLVCGWIAWVMYKTLIRPGKKPRP